jgi:cytoskeleton protein RodZ
MDAQQSVEFAAPEETEVRAQEAYFRPKPDGVIDPTGEAGWFLQRERERRGESLEQAGLATGIHPHHIEAIEHGDMTRMPSRADALQMIAAYADHLGFDPEPLIGHYLQVLPKPAVAPKRSHPADPSPLSSAKVIMFGKLKKMREFKLNLGAMPGGTGGMIASCLGAIMLFAGAVWMINPTGTPGAEKPIVAQADPMATATAEADAAKDIAVQQPVLDDQKPVASVSPAEREAAPVFVQDPQATPTELDGLGAFIEQNIGDAPPAPEASNAKPKANDKLAAAVPQPMQTADGRSFATEEGESRLMLKAKAAVWVRIEDQAGNVIMTQMLRQGDTFKVPNRPGLVVIARDGGALAYMIDGKEKGILGPPGEILVGKSLDLKSLEKDG